VARHPGHRGITKLRNHDPSLVRSELEARFITFLDDAVLPRPDVNTRVENFEVDFAWHEHRVIAELDGYAFHATRFAFEQDRARDRRLQARGWRVVRITWRQLHDHPAPLAAELAALLSLRRT
jgi:very-short-patch-repair endonuclease